MAIHLAMCMLGYTLIEKWAPLTAFQAAIHTLFPFGYVNIYMFSQVGFKFNTVMSILGIGVLIYVISNVASLIMEGRLKSLLKVGQMDKNIEIKESLHNLWRRRDLLVHHGRVLRGKSSIHSHR